jgi:S1-C subfamily serine protease
MTRTLVALTLLALPAAPPAQDAPKKRAFIGVQIARGEDEETIIVRVALPDSPAMKAGLKSGDRLLRIDGAKPKDLLTAVRVIQSLTPGKKAKFLVERDKKEMTIEVTPVALDE